MLSFSHWLLAVGVGGLLTVGLGLLTVGGGGCGDNFLSLRSVTLLIKEPPFFHLALAALAANREGEQNDQYNGDDNPEDPSELAPNVVAAVLVNILIAMAAV